MKRRSEPELRTVLRTVETPSDTGFHVLRGFPAERFTSQEFWDGFDRIQTGTGGEEDELERAQSRLLAERCSRQ